MYYHVEKTLVETDSFDEDDDFMYPTPVRTSSKDPAAHEDVAPEVPVEAVEEVVLAEAEEPATTIEVVTEEEVDVQLRGGVTDRTRRDRRTPAHLLEDYYLED